MLLFGVHQSSLGVHWVMTHREKKLLNHLEGPRFMGRSLAKATHYIALVYWLGNQSKYKNIPLRKAVKSDESLSLANE